jgi:PAS domain S-box-containing protein
MLFCLLLLLLSINATGYVIAIVNVQSLHAGLSILLVIALLATAIPIVLIGRIFLHRLHSASEISMAAEHLANSSVTSLARALQALGEGDFEHPLAVTHATMVGPHHGEAREMVRNFNQLQEAIDGAVITLGKVRESLRRTCDELREGNGRLKSEIGALKKSEEELRNELQNHENRVKEDTRQLSEVTARFQRELAHRFELEEGIQRWEQIFNKSSAGMATINSNDILLSVNAAFAEMHGYKPPELVGQSLSRVIAPEARADIPANNVNAGKKINHTWETTHIRRDGTTFPVLVDLVVVSDASGTALYRAASFRDITENKKLAQAFQLAKEEAENAIRARGQFLSRMSHELRTPLNVILGFSQLLEMNLADPEHHESVGHILKAGKHLLALINEVLDISRIDADKLSLSLQVVPVGETMLSAVTLVRPMAMRRSIELVDQLNSRGVKHVIADNQRLEQIFLNLLSNAVKYNKTGGRVIVWSAERADHRLAVSVTDTGSGIPADKLPHLFTPFERLGADQHGIEGSGLGLALSKRLVELMDGSLEVSSIAGEGSTFSVVLPMASSPVQNLERLSDERLTAKERSALPATCQLLYIEEDLSNVRLVEKLLRPYRKIGVIFAQSGQQGIETAAKQKPDMIILDLDLADIPGEKVLQKLREHPDTASIPVVAISANTHPSRIDQMLRQGAARYLTKPIDVNKLLVVIGEIIKIRENLTS